jgi:predicted TIM-barrel fold metal-dependent hydrolase
MSRKYQVISGDGHLEIPPEPWLKHVPEQYRDRAPRLVKLEDGGEAWLTEGLPLMQNGVNLTGGAPIHHTNESYWKPDGSPRPGTGGPEQRLAEQDQDGIDAEVLYPPVFAGRFIEKIVDRRVYLALVRAYNDFVAEYCSVAPDRLIGNGIIPATGIEDSLAELKRCKELGLRAVAPAKFPNGSDLLQPEEDDRFWELALNLEMPLSPHFTIGQRNPPAHDLTVAGARQTPDLARNLAGTTPGPIWAICQFIASGTLNRFPDLRFYVAETNASWMPSTLFFMDDKWSLQTHVYPGHQLKMRPSEYIAKHFYFGIVRDPLALKHREDLPAENLMWGSDFPHSVGSFPKSRYWLDVIFDDVPLSLRRKIMLENPAHFFGLDLDADITETPVKTSVGAA